MSALTFLLFLVPALVTAIAPAPSPPPQCNCLPNPPPSDPHAFGFYPVTMVLPPNPSASSPTFAATITFFPNNEHDSDEAFTPIPPQLVNLTLDSSCNQIILPFQDCYRLRLQDTCADRFIRCNATTAACGSSDGEIVFPSQAPLKLSFNTSLPLPGLDPSSATVPILCSSGRNPGQGVAGLAPYRLSLVVNVHRRLEALNLRKIFGYCLGRPRGFFFVGQPNYVFPNTTIAPMSYIPTLRWDEDVLPVLHLTGMAIHGGDEFGNVTAPLEESVFAEGLAIGTGRRYLALVDPAYQWLRSTMMAMANASSLVPAPSPFHELDLCYTLAPDMTIDGHGPLLELRFAGNKSWTIDPLNFLVETPSHLVCLGAVSTGSSQGLSSLGTLAQEELIVEYNFEEQMVGVSGSLPRVGTGCGQLGFPN
ncbi:hypothetical protein SELMODRAFT_444417 [Selaginella moellendorffii]|uniref:Xylanase inhibitor C-terminal domain-containing protein n=1 Tax=Selaginella moellendorffii TaxID=88036 RepID=D8S9U5_SELML|nr:hypothetical protein SELMODRAFT_444417 [Selaginella moellendorffii]